MQNYLYAKPFFDENTASSTSLDIHIFSYCPVPLPSLVLYPLPFSLCLFVINRKGGECLCKSTSPRTKIAVCRIISTLLQLHKRCMVPALFQHFLTRNGLFLHDQFVDLFDTFYKKRALLTTIQRFLELFFI